MKQKCKCRKCRRTKKPVPSSVATEKSLLTYLSKIGVKEKLDAAGRVAYGKE